jgi:uncharacterized protein (TIGR01777 family)
VRLVIPGGAGQVGTLIARAWHAQGHDVVVVSRRPVQAPWRSVVWDGVGHGAWTGEIDGADVVINLAGRSVDCRYTAANRREILESRIVSTRLVGEAIARAARPPRAWLQASTATIYAHRLDAPNDEATGAIGGAEPDAPPAWRFSIEVAARWEAALAQAVVPATRKVALRSAMVMSPDRGGVFDALLRLVRWRLGGPAGSGRQFVSWVHDHDFLRAIAWLIDHPAVEGAVNIASPNPLPYAEFMRALRGAWGARIGLPATAWMVEVGTWLLRTESELVLKSRRVVPGRLIAAGFAFEHGEWNEAARDLCARWRVGSETSPAPFPTASCPPP